MGRLSRTTQVGVCVFVLMAAILALLPSVLPTYRLDTATHVGIYFMAILSLNLVLGFTGQISLGQGALMLVGAYTTGILNARHGWPILATIPVSFVFSFTIGALLGLPALRLGGIYLALVTFAFAFAMPQLPLKFGHFFGGGNGLQFNSQSEQWTYTVTWVLAGLLFIGVWLVLHGRTGRAFRAIRDSEIAATSAGVSLPVYKMLSFALSGGIAGVAGSMLAVVTNSFVSPLAFSVFLSLTILIGAAVAGLGSLWGMLLGALFIGILPDVSTSVPVIGSTHGLDVVYAAIVILVMFVMPDGFAGLLRKALLRATRAQRNAAAAPPSAGAAVPPGAAEPV